MSCVAELVDGAGVCHRIAGRTVIGRDPEVADVAVPHDSVSRRHAELRCDDATGAWVVCDLGSTNGTFVDGARVAGPTPLAHRQLVTLGSVDLVFRGFAPAGDVESARTLSTWVLLDGRDRGAAENGAQRTELDAEELACLRLLAARLGAASELGRPGALRGYVRSIDLAAAAGYPRTAWREAWTRSLVRRLRTRLESIGLHDPIDDHERFGYRLRRAPVVVTVR